MANFWEERGYEGNEPYPVVDGLMKHYGDGEARVQVLDGITT